jgi:S-adenosylmethionine:tRNA ribosyltransferase-isomerase
LDRKSGKIEHKHFYHLTDYLRPGDVLVFNDTKVMKARLIGKKETGGRIEVFLLKKENALAGGEIWQCLIGGKGKKEGLHIQFGKGFQGIAVSRNNDGTWEVAFNKKGGEFQKAIGKIGHTPLPPYIKRKDIKADEKAYQTIYANPKKSGSVAAPTAGLHFTGSLMKKLKKKGVRFEYLTLHVGLGTFAPVKVNDIRKHKMHSEYVEINKETMKSLMDAKKRGQRIIAVGTTSARALEAAAGKKKTDGFSGWVDIFIYPGYKFKAIGAMVTNFHLPKSTLLMLVSALGGKKKIDKAYREAVSEGYRYFSYGDAMLIV